MGSFFYHNQIKGNLDRPYNFLNALQIRQSHPLNWRHLIKNKAITTKVNVSFVNISGKPNSLATVATIILKNQLMKSNYVKPAGIQK